jgi:hypothetical protein
MDDVPQVKRKLSHYIASKTACLENSPKNGADGDLQGGRRRAWQKSRL